jgi:hypothetical protein
MPRICTAFDFHVDEASNLALLGIGTIVDYEKY